MWAVVGIIVIGMVVAVYACLWVSGNESRKEEGVCVEEEKRSTDIS